MELLVNAVEPDGLLVGTNCSDDIPVGAVFTAVVKIRWDGNSSELTPVELGPVASVLLVLKDINWWRRSVDEPPRGHSAGLRFEGEGIAEVREALRTKQAREQVLLRG